MRTIFGVCLTALLLWPRLALATCGVERWPVKVAADPDARLINVAPVPAAIETLQGIPSIRPLPQERRVAPVETTTYSVTATMIAYRMAPDSSAWHAGRPPSSAGPGR